MTLVEELLDPVYSKAFRVTNAAAQRIIRLEFDVEQISRVNRDKDLQIARLTDERDRAVRAAESLRDRLYAAQEMNGG